ncbi:hypothetical protein DFH29DRAFT_1048441 [Suillus ampliporus]|nr:hypothetical protein DFH29DRAFT_1048441 [Suillus ampliporus]
MIPNSPGERRDLWQLIGQVACKHYTYVLGGSPLWFLWTADEFAHALQLLTVAQLRSCMVQFNIHERRSRKVDYVDCVTKFIRSRIDDVQVSAIENLCNPFRLIAINSYFDALCDKELMSTIRAPNVSGCKHADDSDSLFPWMASDGFEVMDVHLRCPGVLRSHMLEHYFS